MLILSAAMALAAETSLVVLATEDATVAAESAQRLVDIGLPRDGMVLLWGDRTDPETLDLALAECASRVTSRGALYAVFVGDDVVPDDLSVLNPRALVVTAESADDVASALLATSHRWSVPLPRPEVTMGMEEGPIRPDEGLFVASGVGGGGGWMLFFLAFFGKNTPRFDNDTAHSLLAANWAQTSTSLELAVGSALVGGYGAIEYQHHLTSEGVYAMGGPLVGVELDKADVLLGAGFGRELLFDAGASWQVVGEVRLTSPDTAGIVAMRPQVVVANQRAFLSFHLMLGARGAVVAL